MRLEHTPTDTDPRLMIDVLIVIFFSVVTALLTLVALVNLRWMLDAWLHPDGVDERRFVNGHSSEPVLSMSLVVPARHEEAVLSDTLERLAEADHPCFEVLVVIGHDDDMTRVVAERVAARYPERIQVVIDHNWPKNKPKALNTALAVCQGEIVGVFDAEDEVAPQLFRQVDACFRATGADVVQGGVQLMNYRSSWYALRNVLEYFFYFASRLHLHARQEFLPLGGNTVFFRRDVLERAGGWDPECLAEDCELGVRLSSNGAKTVVAYESALSTREEAPSSLSAFLRQRTRWNQGFLQVLQKGEWRRLPTLRQRARAVYILAMPFLQALFALLLPLQLLSVLVLKVPVLVALLTFVPLVLIGVTLAVETIGLQEFCRMYQLSPRWSDYARLAVWSGAYYLVLAAAAARAAVRELSGAREWEKTTHTGAHRTGAAELFSG